MERVQNESEGQVRKAQCGESRMLRLDGGKGRETLPIRTHCENLSQAFYLMSGFCSDPSPTSTYVDQELAQYRSSRGIALVHQ